MKFAIYLFANLFPALKFLTLLYFSGQDFILETLMRGYSRRLDFLELNPLVDLRRITKLIIHPTLLQKQNKTKQFEFLRMKLTQKLDKEGPL